MSDTDLAIPVRGSFLQKLWALVRPYFWSEERWRARLLLVALVIMTLALVLLGVGFNYWQRSFYDSLQSKNESRFWQLLLIFLCIATPHILISVYRVYFQQMLQIRWRKWLTDRILARWLSNRNYYRLQLESGETDNPEQRIEQDIDSFTSGALDLTFGFLGAVVTLVSFVGILWTISGPLSFEIGGFAVKIPGYMVFVAVLYAGVGSYLTFLIGRALTRINFRLERANASFRFGMTRLRENAESVAFYRGEESEHRVLDMRFHAVWENWWRFMRKQKQLSWFINAYQQLANIFPFVVAAPRYFSGAIDLGTLMQIGDAFLNVSGALSWFITNFAGGGNLTAWKATVDRLTGFLEALERSDAMVPGITVAPAQAGGLSAEQLGIGLPDGRKLIEGLSMQIDKGDRLLLTGPSGSGKTTLFRALAGLWPYGHGRVAIPEGSRALFLPQRPYLPIGSLRDAIAYPAPARDFPDSVVQDALSAVNLSHLRARLDERANWTMALSIGEQQRLAIARTLLIEPDWLFLDEATSALDTANEQRMYQLIADRLPKATVLSIAHRPEVAQYHDRRLTLDPDSRTATATPRGAG